MQKNEKGRIWYIGMFFLLAFIVLGAIWYYYQVRLDTIEREIEMKSSEIDISPVENSCDIKTIEICFGLNKTNIGNEVI